MFSPVPETNPFLSLFPHRWDYLSASHVNPGDKPEWHTETRFPLSDRKILEGKELYGVRFGPQTNYLLIDIDAGSVYHPRRDRFAVGRMLDALEAIGLNAFVPITSSYSSGLHLYLPFEPSVASWQIAAAATWYLQCKGFLVSPGILEIFPNTNSFELELEKRSLFNGHRLPLQAGSYLLDEEWRLTIKSTPEQFCREWDWATRRNDPDLKAIEFGATKFKQRRKRKLSYKAQKFLEDLNQEIDPGWSGYGQTNTILGRITLRAYVFGHVMTEVDKPLTGDDLIAEIVKTATALPGYTDFCRHQGDIWRRAEEWARCAENSSHYYPYGGDRKKIQQPEGAVPTFTAWNQWQERRARERICFAIADQLNHEMWPSGITERFAVLATYGLSGETLYRHADLWHPEHIGKFSTGSEPISGLPKGAGSVGAAPRRKAPNLLTKPGVNPTSDEDLRGFWTGWNLEQGVMSLPECDSGDRTPKIPHSDGSEGGFSSA